MKLSQLIPRHRSPGPSCSGLDISIQRINYYPGSSWLQALSAVTSINYHRNVSVSILPNQRLALIVLQETALRGLALSKPIQFSRR